MASSPFVSMGCGVSERHQAARMECRIDPGGLAHEVPRRPERFGWFRQRCELVLDGVLREHRGGSMSGLRAQFTHDAVKNPPKTWLEPLRTPCPSSGTARSCRNLRNPRSPPPLAHAMPA
jgi:hypothetical protein